VEVQFARPDYSLVKPETPNLAISGPPACVSGSTHFETIPYLILKTITTTPAAISPSGDSKKTSSARRRALALAASL
jgi:hypothetical protein